MTISTCRFLSAALFFAATVGCSLDSDSTSSKAQHSESGDEGGEEIANEDGKEEAAEEAAEETGEEPCTDETAEEVQPQTDPENDRIEEMAAAFAEAFGIETFETETSGAETFAAGPFGSGDDLAVPKCAPSIWWRCKGICWTASPIAWVTVTKFTPWPVCLKVDENEVARNACLSVCSALWTLGCDGAIARCMTLPATGVFPPTSVNNPRFFCLETAQASGCVLPG